MSMATLFFWLVAACAGIWLLFWLVATITARLALRRLRRTLETRLGSAFDALWFNENHTQGIAIHHAARKLCLFTVQWGGVGYHLADFDDLIGMDYHRGETFVTGHGKVALDTIANMISGFKRGGYLGASIGQAVSHSNAGALLSTWKDAFSLGLTFRDGDNPPRQVLLAFLQRPAKLGSVRLQWAVRELEHWSQWLLAIYEANEQAAAERAEPPPPATAHPSRAQTPRTPRVPTVQPGR